ncbi:protein trafficking Pga2 [Xylaria bambusicola]|uniref:protein trafficking Pga2 n=1 Tax=Xylaria bambusicola TaxID=326684 RepID=UPI0020076D31|nr:protein trafficking Pga2 [Xylaria bambusicola]KAI0525652.1 protein trafficking Pga2 [Xylaria bambusicola]
MAEELAGLFVHLGETVWNLVSLISDRMATNVGGSITNMTAQQWIRLIAIVGAYALLRPYIIKLGAKHQEKQFEKAQQEVAEISPNQLRGELGIPDESDDDDDDDAQGEATAADWGKKARKRQRNMIKQLLDAEEKRLQETLDEQEDKDIEEFLVD